MVIYSFISTAAANAGLVSITIKRICAVVGATAFVSFVFMSILLFIAVTIEANHYQTMVIDNSLIVTLFFLTYDAQVQIGVNIKFRLQCVNGKYECHIVQ